ncbi:hypothetical protein HYPSUDRAFT_838923 [Hypholoma sublateritium FD-334 SS-4]|uniref:Uncharacterized protein n=1 Tax=Hypholoma sublateritium (strain FD-334 SS-4) TaxID=945553 RepID=A0A0D2L040_HYPSF|nr:hypothetical protein HYPSUDRAFT_838923 [Hypholoma sublateritium FD-334 SS-4]
MKPFWKKWFRDTEEKVKLFGHQKPRDKKLRHSKSMPLRRDYTIDPSVFVDRPHKPMWKQKGSIRDHNIVLVMGNIDSATGVPILPHELVPHRPPPPTPPSMKVRMKRSFDHFDLRRDQRREILDKFPRPPSKALPDLPPNHLPSGRPENKSGKSVDNPPNQTFAKRIPEPAAPLPKVPPTSLRNNFPILGSRDAVPAKDLLPEPPTHRIFRDRAAQTLGKAREAGQGKAMPDAALHLKSHQRSASNNVAFPRAPEANSVSVSRSQSYEGHTHQRMASNPVLPSKVLAYYGMDVGEPARKESPVARPVEVVHQPRGSHRAMHPDIDYRDNAAASAGRTPMAGPSYSAGSVYSNDSRTSSTSSSSTIKASSRGSAAHNRQLDVPQDVRAISTYSSVSAYSQDSYVTFRPDSQAPPVPYLGDFVLPDNASVMSSALASTHLSSYKDDASSVYSFNSRSTATTSRGPAPFRSPGPVAPPVPPLNLRNHTGSNKLISAPIPLQAHHRNAAKASISTASISTVGNSSTLSHQGHTSTSGHNGHTSSKDSKKTAVASDKDYHSSTHGSHSRKKGGSKLSSDRMYEELGSYGLDPDLFTKEKVVTGSLDRHTRSRRH